MRSKARQAPSTEKDLYQRQLDVFLDRTSAVSLRQALKDGIPLSVIDAAQQSPVLQNGDGLEAGAAAASGIPHAADGRNFAYRLCHRFSLRPARVNWAATVFCRMGDLRIPVQYWRTPVDWRRSRYCGAETDAGDASLQTCGSRRR